MVHWTSANAVKADNLLLGR